MQTIRHPKRAAARAAVLTVTALAAAMCGNVSAQAADGDSTGIAGYPSAQQVLQSSQVHDTVSRFLVAARQAGTAGAADGGAVGAGSAPAAVGAPPRFDLKDPVPMFELSPDFVAGKDRANPQTALRLSYLASRVTATDGHQAAVLLAPKGNGTQPNTTSGNGVQSVGSEGWQLAGVRDGDSELKLVEQGNAQGRSFTEPQIHAWYRLTADGMVEPLNQEATTGLGGKHSVTLAAYQQLVTARYGDKLPGSAYDQKGLAGGYGLTQNQPQQLAAAPASAAASSSWQPAALTGVAALAALTGTAVYLRRRRSSDAS